MNLTSEKPNAVAEPAGMPERLFARFAEVSLELFGGEGTFPMVVPQGQNLARTVEAFERLDCRVAEGPGERWITVTPASRHDTVAA